MANSNEATPIQNTPNLNFKRKDYINWDDYFMSIAFLSAQRSKDPKTQVGACIVNPDKKIVGIGYNGMPTGCSDDELPWCASADNIADTKYAYVCHAEMNAILNACSRDLKNCTIYSTYFPCNECAKLIIQSGIRKVIYKRDNLENYQMNASKRMFQMVGIIYEPFQSSVEKICIDFRPDAGKCSVERIENGTDCLSLTDANNFTK